MTRRAVGGNITLIRRGESIRADWLNEVASTTQRNARKIEDITTEVPEGEDGEGAAEGTETYTETSRVTSTVRIEDASDPTVFVDIERMDSVTLQGDKGGILVLNFNNPP